MDTFHYHEFFKCTYSYHRVVYSNTLDKDVSFGCGPTVILSSVYSLISSVKATNTAQQRGRVRIGVIRQAVPFYFIYIYLFTKYTLFFIDLQKIEKVAQRIPICPPPSFSHAPLLHECNTNYALLYFSFLIVPTCAYSYCAPIIIVDREIDNIINWGVEICSIALVTPS